MTVKFRQLNGFGDETAVSPPPYRLNEEGPSSEERGTSKYGVPLCTALLCLVFLVCIFALLLYIVQMDAAIKNMENEMKYKDKFHQQELQLAVVRQRIQQATAVSVYHDNYQNEYTPSGHKIEAILKLGPFALGFGVF